MANFNLVSPVIALETAIDNAAKEYLHFSISSKYGVTEGILKNKPKFSMTAEYDRLINMDDAFSKINKGLNYFAGKSIGTTRTWTRQVFKGGSYLIVNLETRILAEDKSVRGQVAKLAQLCCPSHFFEDTKEGAEEAKTGWTTSIAKSIEDTLSNVDTKGKIAGFLNLGNTSPPSVTLDISNYFHLGGFAVKTIDWTFSHEQTTTNNKDEGELKGPIFADLTIELMQLEIRNAGTIQWAFNPSKFKSK